ncbi:MAG TPA: GTPase Era [Pyrinomonadaceae bacterium]|jgi:GTP-binding protein Era
MERAKQTEDVKQTDETRPADEVSADEVPPADEAPAVGETPADEASSAAQSSPPDASAASSFHSGYVALIGRPNAGKSTLLNRLVGEKIAAVSNKPQTTRHQIQGVITRPDGQIVLVDTPGVHQPGYLLNRRMMAAVHDALAGVALVCLLRDASVSTGNGDRFVLDLIKQAQKPALLILNKIDKLPDKTKLIPLIEWYAREHDWRAVVPLSARTGDNLEDLLAEVVRHLPAGEPLFGPDELTDQPLRTLVAEIVREKILQVTGDEIPYVTAVVTEQYDESRADLVRINCAILVERETQKKIVVGRGGARIKEIGTQARRDIQRLVGTRVHLELFVKVEADWRNSQRALDEMGIKEG